MIRPSEDFKYFGKKIDANNVQNKASLYELAIYKRFDFESKL
jgi:hypothetical protein